MPPVQDQTALLASLKAIGEDILAEMIAGLGAVEEAASGGGGGGGEGGGGGGAPGGGGGVMASLKASVVPLTAAIFGAQKAFNMAAGAMRGFVEAFAPSALLAFEEAMRDLNAVIGSAVLPLFNILTDTLRELGAVALPLSRQLAPSIRAVAGLLADAVSGWVGVLEVAAQALLPLASLFAQLARFAAPFTSVMQTLARLAVSLAEANLALFGGLLEALLVALTPLAELFAQIRWPAEALAVVLRGVAAGLAVWVRSLASWAGGVDAGVEDFKGAMQALAEAALLAGVALAKLTPYGDEIIGGMRRALAGSRVSAAGFGAPRDARVSGDIASYARDVAALSAVARGGPGGGDRAGEEKLFRDKLLNLLDGIDKRMSSGEVWKMAQAHIAGGVQAGLNNWWSGVRGGMVDFGRRWATDPTPGASAAVRAAMPRGGAAGAAADAGG